MFFHPCHEIHTKRMYQSNAMIMTVVFPLHGQLNEHNMIIIIMMMTITMILMVCLFSLYSTLVGGSFQT